MPVVDQEELEGLHRIQDELATEAAGGVQELSLKDIYEKVMAEEDIIIVIDAVEEMRVRKGLSSIKAKQNAKLRDNNLPPDDSILEFKVHEDAELKKQNKTKIQIYLKRKPTITVHSMIVADGGL